MITRGGEYTGAWQSLDPRVPAVDIQTREKVVINGETRSMGHHVRASWKWVNLVLGKFHGTGLNPNDRARYMGRLLSAEGIESLLMDEVTADSTAGVYVNEWRRGTEVPYTVQIGRILYNNVEGRYSDGNGGWQDKFYRLQALQLNNLRNIPGVDLGWLRVNNKPGQSRPEDVINLHDCSGTPESWIKLHDILVNGAYGSPVDAAYSGGGIMLCDTWGEHQEAVRCTVLETSNYGMAIATGNHARIADSLVLGTGQLPDGTILDADPDAGIYVRNYNPTRGARRPETVIVERNTVGWGRPKKSNPNARWDYSIAEGMATERGNVKLPAGPVRQELLEKAVRDWEASALAAGMVPGAKKWTR